MWDFVEKNSGYMGATADFAEARVIICGAPMDFTVTFRPGARLGPLHIRRVSQGLEEYSPDLDRDLRDYKYFDGGDLVLPPGNVQESVRRIAFAVESLLARAKFPLLLGGEHLISLPAIAAAARFYPELAVLQLDAHLDLRDTYGGEKLSHATVMRRVAEIVGGPSIYQLGVRSGDREEFHYAREHTNLFCNEVLSPLQEIAGALANRPLYVTLDIDVLDPAYAPGTGTPEPGGCSPQEIIRVLHYLQKSGLQVVGMDIVEVSPVYDPSERTSFLAAKLVREAILCFGA
ncbi:MAG: agmatinase [Bacillota bacterium]